MREVNLDSGAVLKVGTAPFADSKALFQAMLSEMRSVHIGAKLELADLVKDLFFIGFSSPLIEARLEKCLERCLYNGMKIGPDTFEDEKAREDYLSVCAEVATENLRPFLKTLFARFQGLLTKIEGFQP